MIMIDTSAWIEFLRKNGDPRIKSKIASLIEHDLAAYTCPVYFELLVGARKQELSLIKEMLSFCQRIEFEPRHWQEAAKIEKGLREKGITVPRDDIFIAVVAIGKNLPIFHRDKHFDIMRNQGGLPISSTPP